MFTSPAFPTPVLPTLADRLRPGQRQMAQWQGGPLAVSAVPGSGKSTGMAIAAALLLAERAKPPQAQGQLVLVTFTRAAVANLKNKIRQYLRELGVPSQNFWVSTLHGLALNIATRHPELSGLDLSQMTLVSPNQSHRLIRACVEQWIAAHPQQYQQLLEGRQFDGEETERLRRQSVLRTEVLPALADTVIHEAKSSGLRPADIEALSLLTERSDPALPDYNILAIAAGLFEHYEALLQARGWIDYDDMILAALRVLEHESARQVWQAQVYAVFEDEAQDSSPLQTQLLKLLAAHPIDPNQPLNLIRVGDPNQAINSTFTPADPIFFREFCQQCQNQGQLAEMDQAGRSAVVIMDAANFMLDWVNQRYPTVQPFRSQHIHPVPPDDPQANANPLPAGAGLEIRYPPDVYQSVNLIGQRVADLLTRYPDARAAVLVRENRQGKFVMDCLQQPARHSMAVDLEQLGITLYEVGAQDRHSHVPAEILALLQFLDRPHSPDNLKAALQVLVDRQLIPTQDLNALATQPEQFLYPGPLASPQPEPMAQARKYCTSLLRAYIELPLFQLIPFLALTLRYDQTELATADKLSDRITQQNRFNPSMNTVLETLREIVQSERFEPVETDEPETRYIRPKQLTIITMHKAKGLDWDFVFIPFLHDNIIPGQLWLLPQAQFLGDYTLSEVARAQIRATVHQESSVPDTLTAWERAGALKVAEEYRLLYVAMTRAKRLLWLSAARQAPFTWGKPENLDDRSPCPVLPALSQKFGKNR